MQRAMNLATAGNDHLAELDAVKMLLSKSHTSQAADDRLENAWWLLDRPGIFPPMTVCVCYWNISATNLSVYLFSV